jgi:transposase
MSQSKFTIKDFKQRYPSDDACLEELMQLRFSNRSTCLNSTCQKVTKFHRVASKRVYECQWCGHQISPTAGTIFHKSATPLSDWFYIMYLMTATRSGVSAKEVQRQLGVTYKTAWRMCNKIRQAMNEKSILKTKLNLIKRMSVVSTEPSVVVELRVSL